MSLRRSPWIVPVLLSTLLAAGCSGGGAGSSGAPAPTPMPPSAVASAPTPPSAAPTVGPSTAPSAPAAPGPAATLPATVGDVSLTISEPDTATYLKVNVGRRLGPILAALGKTDADVQVASANGATEDGSLFIDAVRIDGTDAATLLGAARTALTAPPTTGAKDATVGGKPVIAWTQTSGTTAVYAHDDVLYFIASPIADRVDATVAALP